MIVEEKDARQMCICNRRTLLQPLSIFRSCGSSRYVRLFVDDVAMPVGTE